jgi:hypothetical protein
LGLYGSPALGQFSPPGREPTRSNRRPFLLGCLTGAIALSIGLTLLVVLVGPLPGASPTRTSGAAHSASPPEATLVACTPPPCATVDGLELLVVHMDRDYRPNDLPSWARNDASPPPGFHFVRLVVTFVDQVGEHEVSPYDITLTDALGYPQVALGALSVDDPACITASGATLAAGGRLGPTPMCFQAGGLPRGPLALEWLAGGAAGLGTVTRIPLP